LADAINPSHYKDGWSDGAELISITENLTGNGSQAVQYIARSTRLDESLIKGNPIEDLEKALWFVKRELKRLRGKAGKVKIDCNVLIRDFEPGGKIDMNRVNAQAAANAAIGGRW
jgi:hypothetical protein